MVGAKIGPVLGLIGSTIIIGFDVFLFGTGLPLIRIGLEILLIKFFVTLAIGLAGLYGGISAFKGKEFGNYIPVIIVVLSVICAYIPLGEIVFVFSEFPFISYQTLYLFTSLLSIDWVFLSLGTVLGVLNKMTVRVELRKSEKKLAKIEARKQIKQVLYDFIRTNKGKAFTAESLYIRCISNTNLDIESSEINMICYELHQLGKIDLNIKENVNYYFIS